MENQKRIQIGGDLELPRLAGDTNEIRTLSEDRHRFWIKLMHTKFHEDFLCALRDFFTVLSDVMRPNVKKKKLQTGSQYAWVVICDQSTTICKQILCSKVFYPEFKDQKKIHTEENIITWLKELLNNRTQSQWIFLFTHFSPCLKSCDKLLKQFNEELPKKGIFLYVGFRVEYEPEEQVKFQKIDNCKKLDIHINKEDPRFKDIITEMRKYVKMNFSTTEQGHIQRGITNLENNFVGVNSSDENQIENMKLLSQRIFESLPHLSQDTVSKVLEHSDVTWNNAFKKTIDNNSRISEVKLDKEKKIKHRESTLITPIMVYIPARPEGAA